MNWNELKERLKKIDISLKEFSILLGFQYNSLTKWKRTKIPFYVITIIELLEKMDIGERGAFVAIKKAESREV